MGLSERTGLPLGLQLVSSKFADSVTIAGELLPTLLLRLTPLQLPWSWKEADFVVGRSRSCGCSSLVRIVGGGLGDTDICLQSNSQHLHTPLCSSASSHVCSLPALDCHRQHQAQHSSSPHDLPTLPDAVGAQLPCRASKRVASFLLQSHPHRSCQRRHRPSRVGALAAAGMLPGCSSSRRAEGDEGGGEAGRHEVDGIVEVGGGFAEVLEPPAVADARVQGVDDAVGEGPWEAEGAEPAEGSDVAVGEVLRDRLQGPRDELLLAKIRRVSAAQPRKLTASLGQVLTGAGSKQVKTVRTLEQPGAEREVEEASIGKELEPVLNRSHGGKRGAGARQGHQRSTEQTESRRTVRTVRHPVQHAGNNISGPHNRMQSVRRLS
eukprot:757991-Hanusia_phi.AAC.6